MIRKRSGFAGFMGALGALAMFAVSAVEAQVKSSCVLRGQDTVLATGATVKKCLDLGALEGQNVVVPSNVTRIDNTGFSLCETTRQQGGLADIVYVNDQSGSMKLDYVWISPDGMDTVWLQGIDSNCPNVYNNADRTNHGRITVLNQSGEREVNKLNPAKDPRTRCNNHWSGDPYSQRAIALKGAIDYQAQRAPESRAGYLGFSTGLEGAASPRQLNSQGNIDAVKQHIDIRNEGYTNYATALDQAKKWLTNPTLSPNPTKAVIFVSDGKPYPNETAHLAVLSPTYGPAPGSMPPVYGIFLGVPRADTLRLAELSVQTGGRFFLIPPDRPDSLKAVVERILNIILRQYQPNAATVTNTSTILAPATASAGPNDFFRQADGSWLMNMNSQVMLDTNGGNQISLSTEFKETTTGTLDPRAVNFSLFTTGPEESTNRNLPGTQFGVHCVELPPDPNVVKAAYIRDTDGDGAGDKVFFVFTRPLATLPATIDTVYWNRVAPGFTNKAAPVLSFLPGSGQTVVMADFTASPFDKGLTGIPAGEKPFAVLPQGGVFAGQRPLVNDSIGPILDSGLVRPFDITRTQSGSPLNMDTLTVYVSEPMRTNGTWTGMLRFGKPVNGQCNDYAGAKPVVPAKQPTQNPDLKSFEILIDAGGGEASPVLGDCIYLNVDGTQTDLVRNVPAEYGVRLRGRKPPREIELFRGYPPVAGFTADRPGFLVVNNDPRKGDDKKDYSKPNAAGIYEVTWVPPVGFAEGVPFVPPIPASVNALPAGQEATGPIRLPRGISTVQVVSTGKYIADVTIYDNLGRFMKRFKQAFGYWGELNNQNRATSNNRLASYLVWDMKDYRGQKAGQGVYIWKVVFTFEGNKQEVQYTRTGVVREFDWFLP
jgi:hypothetical protein